MDSIIEEGIFLDDIGSFPLPRGMAIDNLSREQYLTLVSDVWNKKVSAGVEVATYPQFRDMISMFLEPIENPMMIESPYLIKKDFAKIMELMAFSPGKNLRVCVTGPVELYISKFGATNYTDILFNLAKSVARFLENAKEEHKMTVSSLDEPSLGISSNIVFSEDDILNALEIASAPCKCMDSEIHLHSPLYAELCARADGINIIGVESAAHPDYLDLIDKSILEQTDTFLRAGIARTDILAISARLNEQMGVNLWDDPVRLEAEILKHESCDVMKKRLGKAYSIYKDRLRATGPDCGLGSWPSQGLATRILENCAYALRQFRASQK